MTWFDFITVWLAGMGVGIYSTLQYQRLAVNWRHGRRVKREQASRDRWMRKL